MVGIKDITTIVKFSDLLTIPFFVLALLIDGGKMVTEYNSYFTKLGNTGTLIFLVLIFVCVSFIYKMIDAMYCYVVSKIILFNTMYWSGMFFIFLGLLYFASFETNTNIYCLNVFWHLGFISQGIRFLKLS